MAHIKDCFVMKVQRRRRFINCPAFDCVSDDLFPHGFSAVRMGYRAVGCFHERTSAFFAQILLFSALMTVTNNGLPAAFRTFRNRPDFLFFAFSPYFR
jgi:hypothetical protein